MSVMLGLAVAIVLSGLVGLVLGAAVAADSRARSGESEEEAEARFQAQLHGPALQAQLAVLSLTIALLSGAVTAWHAAPGAPCLNAAIVGAIGLAAGLVLPSPGFPRALRIVLSLVNLPVTLAGAWAFLRFSSG